MCAGSLSSDTNTQATSNLGLATSLIGNYMSGQATQDSYSSAIQNAATNAANARQQEFQAGYAGQQQANDIRNKGRQTIASQKAAYGASGLDTNSGVAASTQASTAGQAEAAAQRVSYNTMLQQWGYQQEADAYTNQENNLKTQQKYAGIASLISTGTNLAKMYQSYWGVSNG